MCDFTFAEQHAVAAIHYSYCPSLVRALTTRRDSRKAKASERIAEDVTIARNGCVETTSRKVSAYDDGRRTSGPRNLTRVQTIQSKFRHFLGSNERNADLRSVSLVSARISSGACTWLASASHLAPTSALSDESCAAWAEAERREKRSGGSSDVSAFSMEESETGVLAARAREEESARERQKG
eukprot:4605355-Pleurochrysis_carterae.AAC.1